MLDQVTKQILGTKIQARGFEAKDSLGNTTFKVDDNGNVTLKGNITMTGGSVSWGNITGAPNILDSNTVTTIARNEISTAIIKANQILVGGANGSISFTDLSNKPFIPTTAADVNARPNTWTPTATDVGALPSSTVIPTVPSYITSTKITGTTVESCTLTGNTINGGVINVSTDINVGNKVNVGSSSVLADKYVEFFNSNGNAVSMGMQSDGLLDISAFNGAQIYDFGSQIKLYTNGDLWLHGNKSFKLEATIGGSNTEESIIKHNGSGNLSINHNGSGNIVFNKVPMVNGAKVLTEDTPVYFKFA